MHFHIVSSHSIMFCTKLKRKPLYAISNDIKKACSEVKEKSTITVFGTLMYASIVQSPYTHLLCFVVTLLGSSSSYTHTHKLFFL